MRMRLGIGQAETSSSRDKGMYSPYCIGEIIFTVSENIELSYAFRFARKSLLCIFLNRQNTVESGQMQQQPQDPAAKPHANQSVPRRRILVIDDGGSVRDII